MRDELERYVQTGEPPMGLSADAIIGKGRQHRRWRIGFGVGGGAVAMAMAITGVLALTPANGSGPPPFANPTPSTALCTLPIPGDAVAPSPSITDTAGKGPDKPQPARDAGPFVSGKAYELNCFLSLKVPAQLPEAKFLPLNSYEVPPLGVEIVTSGDQVSYQAGTTIRLGGTHSAFYVNICPEKEQARPADQSPTGFISVTHVDENGGIIVEAWTGSSYIFVSASANPPVNPAFLEAVAAAPELDVFK